MPPKIVKFEKIEIISLNLLAIKIAFEFQPYNQNNR